jgi:hypothetical protein
MSRRLPSISLLCAWLCASGAMLDTAQVIAWARMFAGYAGRESFSASIRDTFDPQKPCAICRALSRARETCGERPPAVPSAGPERLVLILERAAPIVVPPVRIEWTDAPAARARALEAEVPVPPPRLAAA